jgi:hypothetical protein
VINNLKSNINSQYKTSVENNDEEFILTVESNFNFTYSSNSANISIGETSVGLKAKIFDRLLIEKNDYLPLTQIPDATNRSIEKSYPVEAINGLFIVSSSGAATYNIPI